MALILGNYTDVLENLRTLKEAGWRLDTSSGVASSWIRLKEYEADNFCYCPVIALAKFKAGKLFMPACWMDAAMYAELTIIRANDVF